MQAEQRIVRVVLVDDDHEFLDATARYLGRHRDIRVVGAMSRVPEIDTFERDFDVALVDIRMPGGGGVEALRRIRAGRPDVGIIAISGFNDYAEQSEMKDSGAATFLPKGERLDALVEAIRDLARPA